MDIEISAIVRPNSDAVATSMTGSIGYTTALTRYLIEGAQESDVVRAQLADPSTDVLTGLPFKTDESQELTAGQKAERVKAYIAGLSPLKRPRCRSRCSPPPRRSTSTRRPTRRSPPPTARRSSSPWSRDFLQQMGVDESQVQSCIGQMDADTQRRDARETISAQIAAAVRAAGHHAARRDEHRPARRAHGRAGADGRAGGQPLFEEYLPVRRLRRYLMRNNLKKLGVRRTENSPSTINLFAATFEDKDKIADLISRYNEQAAEAHQYLRHRLRGAARCPRSPTPSSTPSPTC